jgi:hypothetical protein
MKYLKLTRTMAFIALGSLFFMSCKKAKVATPLGDGGQTFVKLISGATLGGTPPSFVAKPIDFVNTPTKIYAVEVRRDVANETDLNKTMTVTVKDDTTAISFFNKDTVSSNPNRTNPSKLFYYQLPASWYTIQTDGVKTGGQGGTFTFTFKPGEFAKVIYVTIPNATLFNPSLIYALGFTVLTADAGAKLSTQKSIIVNIGAKNIYDGIYSYVSGLVTRYSAPGVPLGDLLSGPLGPMNSDVIMATIGAYTVELPPAGAGGLNWSYLTMPLNYVAGIDGVKITVDPATNLTNAISTGYATSNATFGNWPGKVNKYDPATKTFTLSFRWNPASTVREYEVVLKYKGPR